MQKTHVPNAQVLNTHLAKTHLSRYLREVEKGKEFVIARSGQPIAKLIPFQVPLKKRRLGGWRGKIWMAPDFNAPLDPETFEPEQ